MSKDSSLIDYIKDFRDFDCRYDNKPRFNFKMTDIQAAIGREQLKKLPGFLLRRKEIFNMYVDGGLDMLWQNNTAVRYRAVLRTEYPELFMKKLEAKGIKTIIPIEKRELLAPTENACKLAGQTLSLPLYPLLTNEEVRYIIKEIKAI